MYESCHVSSRPDDEQRRSGHLELPHRICHDVLQINQKYVKFHSLFVCTFRRSFTGWYTLSYLFLVWCLDSSDRASVVGGSIAHESREATRHFLNLCRCQHFDCGPIGPPPWYVRLVSGDWKQQICTCRSTYSLTYWPVFEWTKSCANSTIGCLWKIKSDVLLIVCNHVYWFSL